MKIPVSSFVRTFEGQHQEVARRRYKRGFYSFIMTSLLIVMVSLWVKSPSSVSYYETWADTALCDGVIDTHAHYGMSAISDGGILPDHDPGSSSCWDIQAEIYKSQRLGSTEDYFRTDLEIMVGEDVFSVVELEALRCLDLQRELQKGQTLGIWHEEGLVYQLMANGEVILPYNEIKNNIRVLYFDKYSYIFFSLILVAAIFAPSWINAFRPGTFYYDPD